MLPTGLRLDIYILSDAKNLAMNFYLTQEIEISSSSTCYYVHPLPNVLTTL